MKILAIDTTTLLGSIAITDDKRVIAEKYLDGKRTHVETLLPAIKDLLKYNALTLKDIDGYGVAIGPGSFTGLRIGLAIIKGLAFVYKKPIVGISSLKSLAFNYAGKEGLVCPIFDARKGQVYFALFKTSNGTKDLENILPERVKDPLDAAKDISLELKRENQIVFLGDGARRYRDIIVNTLRSEVVIPQNELGNPRASNTALLALPRLKANQTDDLDLLEPNYIRKSEAELKPV